MQYELEAGDIFPNAIKFVELTSKGEEMSTKIDNVRVVAGRLIKVKNENPHMFAAHEYISVWVEDANGDNERCLLFTEREIKNAEHRAMRNVEDVPKKKFLTNLFD